MQPLPLQVCPRSLGLHRAAQATTSSTMSCQPETPESPAVVAQWYDLPSRDAGDKSSNRALGKQQSRDHPSRVDAAT